MATDLLHVADQADASSSKSAVVGQALSEILAEGLSPENKSDSDPPTNAPSLTAVSSPAIKPTLWIPAPVAPVRPQRIRQRQPGRAYQPSPSQFRVPRHEPRSCFEYFPYAMYACAIVMAGFAILYGYSSTPLRTSSVGHAVAGPTIIHRAIKIEDVRVGSRLAGENPLREQVDPNLHDPDPRTWRKLSLLMTKPSGHRLWIDLLRPEDWIAAVGAQEGRTFYLELAEMGAVGEALVLALEACPDIRPGPGNVVTGTFHHEADASSKILAIKFSDGAYIHGVTDNHPFWSEDRGDFVEVGQLSEGERVRVRTGTASVVEVTSRFAESGEMLYNLETHNEHVYQVTTAGILVHNSCVPEKLTQIASDRYRKAARRIWENRVGARASSAGLDVHHRIPLEWAHKFPHADPNRGANLIGLKHGANHDALNHAWDDFKRGLAGRDPTASEIMKYAIELDKTFEHTYVFLP